LDEVHVAPHGVGYTRQFADEQALANAWQPGEEDHSMGERDRCQRGINIVPARDHDVVCRMTWSRTANADPFR
jgi:hypothetical protein